ncbi:hypothetical protein A6770_33020 [Nostoc minutum NIES-26]|uniref:Uncharacterized protein n=1 Tax=Nostoc minutum NIES-26 TaxID=1844469 RepID=A0A367Q3W2_9NOSO|nr:hypothetical protein A6770_33020 [Nostoc minutum NIES-26]
MGITIHYSFNAGERPVTEIRQLVGLLHRSAVDLPFEQLDDEIVELTGTECIPSTGSSPDPWYLMKIRAIKIDIYNYQAQEYPVHIVGFTALTRPGAEELDIFLCRYSNSFDWVAHSWCKTQYAQLPEHGGSANFVLAHTMIIALLDKALELGILEEVVDEAGYWQERNPHKLISSSENWNALITEIGNTLGQIPNALKDFLSD